MNYLMLRAALCLFMLTMCFAASHCTANDSGHNTGGNSVLSKVTGVTAGTLPSGNSGVSNLIGAIMHSQYCRRTGSCNAPFGGSGVKSHPVGNSANTQMTQTSDANPQIPAQTTPVTTNTTKNGDLKNVDISSGATSGTPGSSDPLPTVHGADNLVNNPASSLPAAPVPPSPLPLPNSDGEDSDGHVDKANDRDGDALTGDDHNAASGADDKTSDGENGIGGKKGSSGEDSGDLPSRRSVDGAGVIPATPTTTTKTVKPDANKETLTRDADGGSSGSQSLSPTLQTPTSHKTPAANPTRAHTTAPAKSGVNQPSVKSTTTTTSTNSAGQSAQEPAAAKPEEKDTTQLQALKSTTSTAAPTDSKQTSELSTTEFAKGESTSAPTSFPKLSKAMQSLDMKDTSISSSAFFALAALATFVVMAMAPAC